MKNRECALLIKTFFVDGAENPNSKYGAYPLPQVTGATEKGKRKAVALPRIAEGKEKG